MSPQQDADIGRSSRPRSNTNSFVSFTSWRRSKPEHPPLPSLTQAALPLEALIEALTPPAVPSLTYARSLAAALSSHSPLPRPSVLSPVLASLCAVDSPASLQSAGYDILAAYWEHPELGSISTSDRLSYFSFFLGPNNPWGLDSWEPRFKALRAFTKGGSEIIGIETPFLNVLKGWVRGAFEGLITGSDSMDKAERAERERSIDLFARLLTSVVENPQVVARIPEEELGGILQFYAGLVERAMEVPLELSSQDISMLPSITETTLGTLTRSHKRHHSSVSVGSLPSPTAPTTSQLLPIYHHPADIAITLYLNHLTSQLKVLSPRYLDVILPLLFRATAFYALPLPRLTIVSPAPKTLSTDDKLVDTLDQLFNGPYATQCMLMLRHCLLPPSTDPGGSIFASMQSSLGAQRTLRNQIRKSLCSRLARAYISRESSIAYTASGAPGHIDIQRDIMEQAWSKDDIHRWDAGRLGKIMATSVQSWVEYDLAVEERDVEKGREQREKILEEAAGTLKDVLQELDSRDEDNAVLDEEEATAVGETLYRLASYISLLKNHDGTPFIVPLSHPNNAPTPFLRSLSALLARDHTTYLVPSLSTVLLSIAENLTDEDTAKLPIIMADQHELSPTSPDWLGNWENLLGNPVLVTKRLLTRHAVMSSLHFVHESVKDMPSYRRPLADLVLECARREVPIQEVLASNIMDIGGNSELYCNVIWRILEDEVVLRKTEGEDDSSFDTYIDLLLEIASGSEAEEAGDSSVSISTTETHSPSPQATFSTSASSVVSPALSRMQSEYPGAREKESSLPSVMSLLTQLATGSSSRSQSVQPQVFEEPSHQLTSTPTPGLLTQSKVVCAVSALAGIFYQLGLSPLAVSNSNLKLALRIYKMLTTLLAEGKSPKARLTILQFFMRLRADRDHRLYYVNSGYDPDELAAFLASLIGRLDESPTNQQAKGYSDTERIAGDTSEQRKTRPRLPQERDGRRFSGGRGAASSSSAASRSRSRVPPLPPSVATVKAPIWFMPEILPFTFNGADTPSVGLTSYHAGLPDVGMVLPISTYLTAITGIIERERDWDILAYVLCHLPVQLANKHLFCGSKSREVMSRLLSSLCTGILNGELASSIDRWPRGLKARDAHSLAYHTLSVLISYKSSFDIHLRHLLVEVFQAGLNGQPATVKCCLHTLALSAFELQSSMIKCLTRILEKLSQIMSNPDMAVHILEFLSIVGSHPPLHANFTEADFKMVFGVALQYLQHHHQNKSSPTIPWALSQHVRILSYYIIYVWFLAVKLPDRSRHIPFITRQLLLANEGNTEVDDPTEVCFDWLARYTYGSADPRPARSLFSEIVMNPSVSGVEQEKAASEKTWLLGNSVVTIRTLERLGWVEVLSRRPSGFTKFLCRIENAPMVGPGDVDPDTISVAAGLMMERGSPTPLSMSDDCDPGVAKVSQNDMSDVFAVGMSSISEVPRPDPITGYVWSRSAPSQRRKEVAIDPAFFALQLSSYPDIHKAPGTRRVVPQGMLRKFVSTLDRIPVIDTHKVGIMYVAPGQKDEIDILRNAHGSPAYTRFLEGIGRLINLRGQVDVYAGGLNPDEDGEYAYAWWDDIGQILYHTATMMPSNPNDPQLTNKKRHIGNDFVRIIWNDSGEPYRFDTLSTQFQFVNIIIEPHSAGAVSAFSNNLHENEYFKVTIQRAPDMTEFTPIGHFKLISAENLPLLVRQLSLLADWFASVFERTQNDTARVEMKTNWHVRLEAIRRFQNQLHTPEVMETVDGIMGQEACRDFTIEFS